MNVLLVDDHVIVRDALKRLLAALAPTAVTEVGDGQRALEAVSAARFDLVVLDLNLPGLGGLELLRRLTQAGCRVLVFSTHAELVYVSRALEAGAAGYVSKNAAPDEILTAVRKVAAGGRYVEHELAQALAIETAGTERGVERLGARDLEILRLLAAGRSLTEIADALGLRYKTVANVCSQIKAKLGVSRTTDLVRFALEAGVT